MLSNANMQHFMAMILMIYAVTNLQFEVWHTANDKICIYMCDK